MSPILRKTWLALLLLLAWAPTTLYADAISNNPVVFVTMVPNPNDFGTLAATFGNHLTAPTEAFRGGDLWIRYPNGTLKNLTQAAGYGSTGLQGANAIAVRDPSPHWDGAKLIFSMLIGAPTQQYQVINKRWQLYEITGLGESDTPSITKVPNQPEEYNNIAPIYGSDDSIIFVSDHPRDTTVLHTYPQRDEYESSPTNTGLWKLTPQNGGLRLLDHAPSGDFNPIIDSFGRVIFTRWDHLQRDQQNVGVNFGAFNHQSEASAVKLDSAPEVYPEPRSVNDPDYNQKINLFTINQFFPWMMLQNGTELETLNHIGRQEVGVYSERSFNDDPNVEEFYGQYQTGANQNEFVIFLHIKESPQSAGTYLGTNCQEFGTHAAGQIISITGAPSVNPNDMLVTYLTHPDTAGASDTPSPNHSGLYRDALPLTNGKIIAAHTSNTRQDANIGSASNPLSRYDFRLKVLVQNGQYYKNGATLTNGISKNISFWSPDQMISYNGPLWEMMPVELVSRTRPPLQEHTLPAIEASVLSNLNIAESGLKSYLSENNLALIISRNVTMRDKNDRQQPTNLRIPGGVSALPNSGKIYDLAFMQIFQGDLIRGYENRSGRRVLAQPMHSVASGTNPTLSGAPSGSVELGLDGSMAAFVPAGRALTWQLVSPDGTPVVRERYWLTFQPGEIRVCTSCHGINGTDHLGNSPPENVPQALVALLSHYKNLPPPSFGSYALSTTSAAKKAKGGFAILVSTPASTGAHNLRVKINGRQCNLSYPLSEGLENLALSGRFPNLRGARIRLSLTTLQSSTAIRSLNFKLKGKQANLSNKRHRIGCRQLLDSLN